MLRLMSHNQWRCDDNLPDWEKRGLDCSASVRVRGFVRVFRDLMPDVIGCQEVSPMMADKLIRYLAEDGLRYSLLWGRDTPIVYRPDKVELIDSDFSVYPTKCPVYPGEFNNGLTKSWNLAVFRSKTSYRTFVFVSTHLWWMSEDPQNKHYQKGSDFARAFQLELAINKAKEFQQRYDCPVIIVGDFNANYDSIALKKAFAHGFTHAHDCATDYKDETQGYHWCGPDGFEEYQNGGFRDAIDHIIIGNAEPNFVKQFQRYSPDYYLPLSDHSPVFIDAQL